MQGGILRKKLLYFKIKSKEWINRSSFWKIAQCDALTYWDKVNKISLMEGFDFNHIFIYWAENINFSKSHLLQIDKLVKLQDFFFRMIERYSLTIFFKILLCTTAFLPLIRLTTEPVHALYNIIRLVQQKRN